MILKILLVVGVIAFIYFKFIKKKPQVEKSANKKDEQKSNDMVECATCKIYCSLEDSLISGGKYYCSRECLESIK
ncbi:conserved hypothetical protein [Sulfurimonas denitrificans DSM 1251]|jgi:uncharacterized protein|uniref:Prokaryotic metallothionein n=1 Tax=Sulfurimonas denitrificans (strain ATCC 33889 / DSM 1251) TaxID=326298 RepID=Q30TL8_SULDN|nr:PP0621 family protein [Sulfurimonas denitrificans]ABB43663.1 conserved hypothetical protein [Sulfurimonas denitrificans DSM 1251]MDD3442553.1 PP0621 family protein [Sulfurimonas denitrificans]